MSDITSFNRQWLLLKTLTARGAGRTLRELADEFQVSEKTIRRDLDELKQVGFTLDSSNGAHGQKHWRIEQQSILAGLVFNFEEVAALYLGRRFLEPLAGTHLWQAAQNAFRKIRAGLGDDKLRYLEKLATAFHQTTLGISDYGQRAELLDALMVGIEDHRVTRLLYHSLRAEQPTSIEIHPYGVIYHRGTLYLVALDTARDELRHYKLDRVRDVEVLADQTFLPPSEFNLQAHLADSFGIFHGQEEPQTVRIRFSAEVARYVQEHHWHPSQTLTPHPDGGLTLELRLSRLEEIKSWLLSFGPHATAEAPEELQEQIRQDLIKMSASYENERLAQ